jgi:hypothetical protein
LAWSVGVLVVLAVLLLGAFLYVRWNGVPPFFQARLEAALRAHGIELHIGEVRLRGSHLQARSLAATVNSKPGTAQGKAGSIDLQLDWKALLKRQLRLHTLHLDGGRFDWIEASSNNVPHRLAIEGLETDLRILPSDHWELTRLSGRLFGAEVHVTASITNASLMRRWSFRRPGREKTDWQQALDQVLDKIEAVKLAQPAVLNVHLSGDGRDPSSLQTELELETPTASWADTTVEKLRFRAIARPANGLPGASAVDFRIRSGRASGNWGEVTSASITGRFLGGLTNQSLQELHWKLQLAAFRFATVTGQSLAASATTVPSTNPASPYHTEMDLKVTALVTPWSDSATNHLTLSGNHGLNRLAPWELEWAAAVSLAQSRWGQVRRLEFSGRGGPRVPFAQWQPPEASWGFWQKLDPYEFSWKCAVEGLNTPKLQLDRASCAGQWAAPEVVLEEVHSELYGGHAQGAGRLDVATREVRSHAALDFDVRKVSALLTPASRHWLSQFTWQIPPQVSADVRVLLPAWTNAQPQWREEVMPTIELTGQFAGSNGTFRAVPVAYARSHFTLTNLVWHLPDLLVRRPDGEGLLEYTGSMATHDFRWRVDARADPRAFKPLLTDDAAHRALDQFDFRVPPAFQGEVWGRWHEPEALGLSGRLTATNFTFRGEWVTELQSSVALTNATLQFSDTVVRHNAQVITVPKGSFDFTERVADVTNAVSTMDPDLVTRVIGPKVRAALAPYHFDKPPTVRISGRLPTFDTQDADVHFAVAGESFHYWRLQSPGLTGDIHWRGDSLVITNVQASFYGGDLTWQGQFDFSVPVGATLAFEGSFKNADLHDLVADLGKKTNNLKGALDAHLTITAANSDDWRSWQGNGYLSLRDGFLWEIPIFGFFSPVLNTIVPGLGSSPVSACDASFTIDQSVVETDNLELMSPALRLQYSGNVDFKGDVDARMHAVILRDAWGVGRVLSVALWPISKAFEYQIKGNIYHPNSEPVYIPRVLMWALHPVKTMKKLFHGKEAAPSAAEAQLNSVLPHD